MSGGDRAERTVLGVNMISLWLILVCVVQTSGMLAHVDRYEVVQPQRLQGRHKRSLQDNQLYPDTVQYELAIEGRNHTIHLEKNRNLIGRGFTETHYSEDGKRVTASPNEEHCYYHGHIEGMKDSSVSVGICSGISGFVRAQQQVYLIEPLGQSEDGDHAVYRQEHRKISGNSSSNNTTIMYDQEKDQDQDPRLSGLFRSRSWKTTPIAGPLRFVELFVVVDNIEHKRHGSKIRSRILGIINHVDKLYRPLNIRVMLVGLEIWTDKDHIDIDKNPEITLDNFLLWRQADLLQRTKHDNAQLVTGKDFEGDTVGLANKFAMCTDNSGGVNQDHNDNPIGLASTIAHEMGHNFGLSHDAAGCMCGPSHSSDNCVMTDRLRTASQAFPEFFSSCSLEQLADYMERAQPTCLFKPSFERIIAVGPTCGNALLDPGEECDCGTPQECKNPCCDASTCRLTEGSLCAHGQCCDNCQIKLAGSVCRKSASTCDLPEYCTGASEDCPEDSFEMNGKPCYNQAQGYCYNGQCPTHQQHCWRLFGPGTHVGSDVCFNLNRRGQEGANCGGNRSSYIPCTAANVMCGSMFCEGGGVSITGKRATYTVFSIECKLAVDDDKTRNIDMVPRGTKCGPNRVCLDNRCVDKAVYGKREDCAKKCNNNGVCNHKRECHCNPSWAPPYCDIQYADLPQGHNGIIAGVCAALTILLAITAVTAGLMCCKKGNRDKYTSKRIEHPASCQLNPMFQELTVKDRPQISQPTFMESTATQACAPLIVAGSLSRAAPQPPKKQETSVSPTSQTEPTKPLPPSKPLPPLSTTQFKAAKPSPPPVPPVKPSPPPPPPPPAKPQPHRLT